jgi:hypothetical protein
MEEVQNCWSFEHTSIDQVGVVLDQDDMPTTNSHNVRASNHTFYIPNEGVCHGLAGYFEAHLFGNVVLSIHPDPNRATKDMMSWFPIFFPFKVIDESGKEEIACTLTLFHPSKTGPNTSGTKFRARCQHMETYLQHQSVVRMDGASLCLHSQG